MGFKIEMEGLSKEEMQKIRDDRPTGRYDGPTPPPGVYNMVVDRMWFAETKSGLPAVKASFRIKEPAESDNAVYNGASTINNYLIPQKRSDRNYSIQASSLDDFLSGISNGKLDFPGFYEAMVSGRSDVGTEDKIGHPVKQIGNFKFTGDAEMSVKTKIREYNGNEYIDIHYIIRDLENNKAESIGDDIDLGGDDDLDDDDVDSWLEG